MGLTGWLSPKGEFLPCKHGEHYVLAQEVTHSDFPYSSYNKLKEQLHYIPMGVNNDPDKSYVFIHIDSNAQEPIITNEQIKWFEENMQLLDKGQKEMVMDWLEDELAEEKSEIEGNG